MALLVSGYKYLKTKTMKDLFKPIAFVLFCALSVSALITYGSEPVKPKLNRVQEFEKQNSELIDLVVKLQNDEI